MKTPIIATALTLALSFAAATSVSAQQLNRTGVIPPPKPKDATLPGSGGSGTTQITPPKAAPAPRDPNVLKSGQAVQEPVSLDEIQPPKIGPIAEPIDGFLLQKEHGPFMVTAYTFRGPDSAKYAQILAMELRHEYQLPAYIWFARVQPMRSNIQGIQPTAPSFARNGDMAPPERLRTYDEAAVLVGNCKTIDEAGKLLKQVKKIVPHCLKDFPVIYQNRKGKGLNRSTITTNPFQAAQNVYPGNGPQGPGGGVALKNGQAFDPSTIVANFEQNRKLDPMIKRINAGPNSIFKNTGAYTIQVAEYSGRANILPTGAIVRDDKESLKRSPLQSAADDAERLAEALNKCQSMNGTKAYVYHTRYSSIVAVGSFNSPNDPNSKVVSDNLTAVSNELIKRGFSQIALRPSKSMMPVPKDR